MAGEISRLIRTNLIDVIQADYITTAKAKGKSRMGIVIFHALKMSILPVINAPPSNDVNRSEEHTSRENRVWELLYNLPESHQSNLYVLNAKSLLPCSIPTQ